MRNGKVLGKGGAASTDTTLVAMKGGGEMGHRRTLFADDCLSVLKDELAIPTGSVNLIYLDPPFNSKSKYNLPFKGKYKSARPVEAFKDTWEWNEEREGELLRELDSGPQTKLIADVVRFAQRIESTQTKNRLDAYLINMAVRLIPMYRILKPTGTVYLHCDRTASHYLKLIMDVIFGKHRFRNQIVWCYRGGGVPTHDFAHKHDIILRYSKQEKVIFNLDAVRVPYSESVINSPPSRYDKSYRTNKVYSGYRPNEKGKHPEDWWPIQPLMPSDRKERLGYPTQKPLKLLRRIIEASSNPGDMVLDPFCGCGTASHAAEELGRRWIGIDISPFSTGLIRNRILSNFNSIRSTDVRMLGVPATPDDARQLAKREPFEFEKWACGHIGAEGLFHAPGKRGADRGVDGVLKFYPMHMSKKPEANYAIVQVKGGNVTPDAVGRLYDTVTQLDATAGVMICFERQMRTVENNRNKQTFTDLTGKYPVIQGLSVEALLKGKEPNLPNLPRAA